MPGSPQQNPEPRFNIRFEGKEHYLLAVVSGECDTLLEVFDYARQMIHECRRRGFSRLLYVRDIVRPLTLPGAVLASAQLGDLLEGLSVAAVDLHVGYGGVNHSAEATAARRGLQMRVFGSVPEAEAWLASLPT